MAARIRDGKRIDSYETIRARGIAALEDLLEINQLERIEEPTPEEAVAEVAAMRAAYRLSDARAFMGEIRALRDTLFGIMELAARARKSGLAHPGTSPELITRLLAAIPESAELTTSVPERTGESIAIARARAGRGRVISVRRVSDAQRWALRVLFEHDSAGGVWVSDMRAHAITMRTVRALERATLVERHRGKARLTDAGRPIGAEEHAEYLRQRAARRAQEQRG